MGDGEDYSTLMCRRDYILMVGTSKGGVKIRHYADFPIFDHLPCWDETIEGGIRQFDFNKNLVVISSHLQLKSIHVKNLDGRKCRSISSPEMIFCMTLDGDYLISSHGDKIVR